MHQILDVGAIIGEHQGRSIFATITLDNGIYAYQGIGDLGDVADSGLYLAPGLIYAKTDGDEKLLGKHGHTAQTHRISRLASITSDLAVLSNKAAYQLSLQAATNMLGNLKREGFDQYLATIAIGSEKYTITSPTSIGRALSLWGDLTQELLHREMGTLITIPSTKDCSEELKILSDLIIYRYFDGGFDMLMPITRALSENGRISVVFDERIASAFRSE